MEVYRYVFGLIVLLNISFSKTVAQEFIDYNLADGLSGIEVTDIKENENFVWIATTDGLNRFDGRNFKIYKHETNNPNSLGENYIESLYFDSGGLLWIGLKSGGADIYDPMNETFIHLKDVIDAKVPVRVISITGDSQGNIWLGTWEEGVYRLTPVRGDNRHFTVEIHYPGYIVSSLLEKPAGFLRVGTYFGFFTYDIAGKSWKDSEHQNISVTQFLDTGDENEVWCATWYSGIIRLKWDSSDPGRMVFNKHYQGEKFNSVFRMIESRDGSIFLGTWGKGILRFNPASSEKITELSENYYPSALINSFYRDQFNNLWAGTYGEGIIRFNDEETGLSHFPITGSLPSQASSLKSPGKNKVLIGTMGSGLYLLDLEKNLLTPLWSNSNKGDMRNYILSLNVKDDTVFIGHDGSGITFYGGTNSRLRNVLFPTIEKVTAIYQSVDGTLWTGTKQSGLSSFRFDKKTGNPGFYVHYNDFTRDQITGFAPWDDSTMLISSHSGLYRFNFNKGRITEDGKFSSDLIYNMQYDEKNNCLWIGTSTNVMMLNYKEADILRPAFPDYGLPQGAIRSMVIDRRNNLWFSVGERLFCYPDDEKSVREVNPVISGDKAILSSAVIKTDKNEKLVFGTTGNLIIIDPEVLLNRKDKSKVVLIDLQIDHNRVHAGDKIFGTVVTHKAPEFATSIDLSYKCRWISFQFAETGTDLFVNRYQYYIEGFSDRWQSLNIHNPLTFSQLNPGEYTLRIRKYGFRNESLDSWALTLNINPPWWRTVWFSVLLIIFILLVSLLAGFIIIRYNNKRHAAELIRIEKEKEDELLREKESFFTGLSHDLMTPFSLIMSPANELLREYSKEDGIKEKLRIIRKNASFLSDIFSTILDFKRAELSDDEVKLVQFEVIAFTRLVVNAFEHSANSRNIILRFNSNIESLEVVSDNVKIERILFNLISNALKFTPDGGKVEVEIKLDNDRLVLIVRDNGSGMEIAKQSRVFEKFYSESEGEFHRKNKGLGLGLYIVRKFTDKLNGVISVKSAPAKGTEIAISIPVRIISEIFVDGSDNEPAEFSEDKPTVLVVEDNSEMRDYLRNKLTSHFNVFTSESGEKALEYVGKIMPEIIITDIMMPEMDGLTLTRRIKEDDRFADIFVVLLTARITTDDELEGYRTGADLYIRKPFDGEVLLSQMINIYATIRKRRSQIMKWLVSDDDSADIEIDSESLFISRSRKIIEEHINEPDFKINHFAAELNMSKSVLHRKFRLLIGETPNHFIRLIRLRKSVQLLQTTDHSVAEIAYLTGFNQAHYFIKCFKEVYHTTPGEFRTAKKIQL